MRAGLLCFLNIKYVKLRKVKLRNWKISRTNSNGNSWTLAFSSLSRNLEVNWKLGRYALVSLTKKINSKLKGSTSRYQFASNSRTEGQFAAFNDCLYRSMARTGWLLVIDVDELVFPRKVKTLQELLNSIQSHFHPSTKAPAALLFRNVFFYTRWEVCKLLCSI